MLCPLTSEAVSGDGTPSDPYTDRAIQPFDSVISPVMGLRRTGPTGDEKTERQVSACVCGGGEVKCRSLGKSISRVPQKCLTGTSLYIELTMVTFYLTQ